MIQSPITRVLSSMKKNGVRCLLMGGQACVFYGGAEFSRDIDLAMLFIEVCVHNLERECPNSLGSLQLVTQSNLENAVDEKDAELTVCGLMVRHCFERDSFHVGSLQDHVVGIREIGTA